jgi:hypothetical protein
MENVDGALEGLCRDVRRSTSRVMRGLELMGVAEELCDELDARDAFAHLCPTPYIIMLSDAVYEHHARELIERWRERGDMAQPTRAEMLGALSELSLRRPPGRAEEFVYHRLFREVCGPEHHDAILGSNPAPREEWPGQADELLGSLHKRGRVAARAEVRERD